MSGALAMSVVVFSMRELRAVMAAGFFLGLFGYMIMPVINTLLFDVIPPETRSSALAADGIILSTISALTSLSIGSVSYYVGKMQGLTEGNLQVGFQGAVTVLMIGGVIFSLLLRVATPRTAPADMAALRQYIAQRAVGTKPLPEETYQ
jgi:MFS family permease